MPKKIILVLFFSALMLSACGRGQPAIAPVAPENDNEEQADQAMACSYICERGIQKLCETEIEDFKTEGRDLNETIFDKMSCQLICEAHWDKSAIACALNADECAQLSSEDPYCIDDSAENENLTGSEGLPGNCIRACRNYVKCVSYGDDVTKADQQDAFESCLEYCFNWDRETLNCLSNTAINRPNDCGAQTACVLKEVRDLMNR